MRIAVLGCGSIGRRHLKNVQSLGYSDLLAFDPVADVRQHVESDLGVPCVTTLDEVWGLRPKVVIIAAPSNMHTDLALPAAAHGCHLFIEKPLSHTLDGLDQLCAEIAQRRLVTMVACNMRFHPGPTIIKQLIDAGAIGAIIAAHIHTGSYLPNWRPWQDYRQSYSASPAWGGATLDCIHEIDLALWYAGPAIVVGAASVRARTIGIETDGLVEILLRHDGGILSNVHLNFVQRNYDRGCKIIGAEGTLVWDYNSRQVVRFGPDGERAQLIAEPEEWQLNQMYLDEIDHWLQSVRSGQPTVNPIAGGIAALRIALDVRQRGILV